MQDQRVQRQDLHQHIQQISEHINFRRILTIAAVTLRFGTIIELDFNKRYNISDFSHHRSQIDATTCPECPGMCWTRQHTGRCDHHQTTA